MADFRALRVVLNCHESSETAELRREVTAMRSSLDRLEEAKMACPALFAREGDLFVHRADRRYDGTDLMDVFEYLGRTVGSGTQPYVTPPGWLIFKHVDGAWGIEDGFGAVNGGVRDAIGAWPQSAYRVYDNNGNFEKGVMCLPPEKCYCFRLHEEMFDDDVVHNDIPTSIEDDDDDEDEDDDGDGYE
ncbi:hypothetical protein RI054_03g16710 [Pseudoscourfieldia marina]